MAANYSNVTIGTSATLILPAVSSSVRRGSLIANNGNSTVYLGMDANVTAANGLPIATGSSLINSGNSDLWRGDVWGITNSGTADIRYWVWSE